MLHPFEDAPACKLCGVVPASECDCFGCIECGELYLDGDKNKGRDGKTRCGSCHARHTDTQADLRRCGERPSFNAEVARARRVLNARAVTFANAAKVVGDDMDESALIALALSERGLERAAVAWVSLLTADERRAYVSDRNVLVPSEVSSRATCKKCHRFLSRSGRCSACIK